MFGNGGCAGAIQPELFARIGAYGNKAFARSSIGDTHDLGGGTGDGIFIVADDIADQDHFGPGGASAFGGVTDSL